LFERGFDAIFMGTGAGKPKRLEIPGINHHGVRQAVWFLRRVSLLQDGSVGRDEVVVSEGDKVAIIGCGNTGIDAARTALRMGASSVKVIYHRGIDSMSALKAEYDDAVAEGVEFLWNSSVVNIEPLDDKRLKSVTISSEGKEYEMPLDWLVLAVGSVPASRIVSTTDGIEVDDRGYVLTREVPYGMTTRKGVFAGGDVTNRPATVVHAMQDAKLVADGITKYVDAIKLLEAINLKE
ncbi:MAG: FAD-dependent oxidoreductase, partial [Muribaculaceae bacterium]|nr:FAD-dependent oxidoreductase [Muribaculaceae bacterium]